MFKNAAKELLGFDPKRREPKQKNNTANNLKLLSSKLDDNLETIQQKFGKTTDVVFRQFTINLATPFRACAVYVEGLSDKNLSSEHIMRATMEPSANPPAQEDIADSILKRLITLTNTKKTNNLTDLTNLVLEGNLALVIDGSKEAIIAGVQGWDRRSIEEPPTEPIVRGPKDGFVEDLRVNTSMIRRRIKTTDLQLERFVIGRKTRTAIEILYLKDVASDKIVEEVRRRLNRIDIDGILDSGYIQELISDEAWTLFPTMQTTERPDKLAAAILQGRIGILVDTTPMSLIAPTTFVSLLQSSEDYYEVAIFSSAIRLLRYLALNIALMLPAFYIAVASFHQEFLPSALMKTIIDSRAGVPFPAFLETILMEIAFEILREAGARLPRNVGQTVSTVGGIIIGQAAVTAGLISTATVVVVALTAVTSFTAPNYSVEFTLNVIKLSS